MKVGENFEERGDKRGKQGWGRVGESQEKNQPIRENSMKVASCQRKKKGLKKSENLFTRRAGEKRYRGETAPQSHRAKKGKVHQEAT